MTAISPLACSMAIRSALRFPACGVHVHSKPGVAAQTSARPGSCGPLITTSTSCGSCAMIRERTSRNSSGSSPATGMSTDTEVCQPRSHGR